MKEGRPIVIIKAIIYRFSSLIIYHVIGFVLEVKVGTLSLGPGSTVQETLKLAIKVYFCPEPTAFCTAVSVNCFT